MLHRGHSSRLARRPEVAQRIAELRADRNEAESISPQRLIAALLRMAKVGEMSSSTDRVKEARLALLDAARLQAAAAHGRREDQLVIAEQSDVQEPAPPAADLPGRARRLPGTCLEPTRERPGPAARLPLDGPSPAALLPAPVSRLPLPRLEAEPRPMPMPVPRPPSPGARLPGLGA